MTGPFRRWARRLFAWLPLTRRQRLRLLEATYRWGGPLFSDLPNYQRWAAAQNQDLGAERRGMPAEAAGAATAPLPVAVVVDSYVPRPDRDTGSRLVASYMGGLRRAGFRVVFWPYWTWWDPVYGPILEQSGVEVVHGAEALDLPGWVAERTARGLGPALVWLSRPAVGDELLPMLRAVWAGPIVYGGIDVHYRRLERQRTLCAARGRDPGPDDIERMRLVEEACWRRADVAVYPSESEVDLVDRTVGASRAVLVPVGVYDGGAVTTTVHERTGADVVLVANFAHEPNVDGLRWFMDECLPVLRRAVPASRLVVVGEGCPLPQGDSLPGVKVTGPVTDEELEAWYGRVRAAVVPVRFGAGVKGKTLEALTYGVPVVTTRCGAEGVGGLAAVVDVADDGAGFAAAVVELLTMGAGWRERSRRGREFAASRCSVGAFDEAMAAVIRRCRGG